MQDVIDFSSCALLNHKACICYNYQLLLIGDTAFTKILLKQLGVLQRELPELLALTPKCQGTGEEGATELSHSEAAELCSPKHVFWALNTCWDSTQRALGENFSEFSHCRPSDLLHFGYTQSLGCSRTLQPRKPSKDTILES